MEVISVRMIQREYATIITSLLAKHQTLQVPHFLIKSAIVYSI